MELTNYTTIKDNMKHHKNNTRTYWLANTQQQFKIKQNTKRKSQCKYYNTEHNIFKHVNGAHCVKSAFVGHRPYWSKKGKVGQKYKN